MATPKFIKIDLYSHFASALINDDTSGLEDAEERQLDRIIEQIKADYETKLCYCVDCSEDHFFGTPDYGPLAGDLCTYTFQIDSNV